ncbi:MAG: hypothetical protein P8101_11280 [Candidatus Thiodiazotropha sp.]|jgi:hypothetical protein
MSVRSTVRQKVRQNTQILDILSTADLIKAWENTTGKEIAQVVGEAARFGANYVSAVLDANVATKLIDDMGWKGRAVLKTVEGKQYIVFKGRPGARSIFTGTRYLATTPKVVDMAVGKLGANKAIVSGARLTIFLVVPLNILNYLLSDRQTMSDLLGTTATDLAKVGIASAVASIAATATTAATTIVVGPIIVAIAVGLVTAYALDALDSKFGITDALVKAIDKAYDSTFGEFGRQLNQVERHLNWQIENGLPVGQGIFY